MTTTANYADRIRLAFYPWGNIHPENPRGFQAALWGMYALRGSVEMRGFVLFVEKHVNLRRIAKQKIPILGERVLMDMVRSWDKSPERRDLLLGLWPKQEDIEYIAAVTKSAQNRN